MKSIVVLGGPLDLIPADFFVQIKHKKISDPTLKVIGVDHGNIALLNNNIVPDVSVGDYDSLSYPEQQKLEANVSDIRYAKTEKDFTDSEFGINVAIADFKSSEVLVYGSTGGRIDHLLVNLFTFLKPEFRGVAERIKLVDQQNYIEFFNPGRYTIKRKPEYKYLAFVNLMATDKLTIEDAKYTLQDYSVDYPVSWSSNEFVKETASFSFASGFVAVIYSKDLAK